MKRSVTLRSVSTRLSADPEEIALSTSAIRELLESSTRHRSGGYACYFPPIDTAQAFRSGKMRPCPIPPTLMNYLRNKKILWICKVFARQRPTVPRSRNPQLTLNRIPENRTHFLQRTAEPHRSDPRSEPRRIVGFHRQRAERGRTARRLELRLRDLADETAERLVLRHADHGVVVAGHADVGDERGAGLENAVVGRRHVGVGADHKARAAVGDVSH